MLTLAPTPLSPSRALRYFNLFRAASVAALLITTQWAMPTQPGDHAQLWAWVGLYGALVAVGALLPRLPLALEWTLSASLAGDILLLVAFMHYYDGVGSGFGMLLLPFLAVAGMLVPSRIAGFYAALATLAVFGSVLLHASQGLLDARELLQAALLAMACFVTSGITSLLGNKARVSENLAAARQREVASLNRVNALVLQALREAVVVVDEAGVVRHFNSRAERVFGPLRREAVLPELASRVGRWQQQGRPPYAQTAEVNVRGQQLLGRMVPLEEGGVRLLVFFLQNVADLAAEAQRLKLTALGRLTANMAHEIRNPLSAISHAAELLMEDAADATGQRLAAMVRDNSRRINRLVEEVLQLGRRDRLQPENIVLASFLAELVDGFVLANPDAAGCIRTRFVAHGSTRFDRGHLQQILTNLLANGWRHGSGGAGALWLEVEEDGIAVCDDGPGVAAEAQGHLFEPFFTTESSGTGLGLYIARELAEANGARLDYHGPGGRFRLTLPPAG